MTAKKDSLIKKGVIKNCSLKKILTAQRLKVMLLKQQLLLQDTFHKNCQRPLLPNGRDRKMFLYLTSPTSTQVRMHVECKKEKVVAFFLLLWGTV